MMSDPGKAIRNILVHVDGSEASSRLLRIARGIAKRQRAHVFVQFCVEASIGGMRLALSDVPAALFETRTGAALDHARQAFDEDVDESTWLEPLEQGASDAFLRQARLADLVVMGAAEPSASGAPSADLAEKVLLESGRPLLLLPSHLQSWSGNASALVGWNGSAQAARALADALPWLRGAARVHVLISRECEEASRDDGLEVHGALRRHGIEAVMHRADGDAPGEDNAGQRLACLAADLGVGLVVMGGYGHGRLQERVLGGATSFMMRWASLPVLMAH